MHSIQFLEDWAFEHTGRFAVKKYFMLRGVVVSEGTWDSISQFVTNALSAFEFKEAEALFTRPTEFKIGDLGKEKIIVFLNVSDFDNLVNLFYTQALISETDKQPGNRLKAPVRIILDDFAANAQIPDFDKTI